MLQDESEPTNRCRSYVWSEESDNRLLHLRKCGYTHGRIAELLGCPSEDVVRRRFKKLTAKITNAPQPAVGFPMSEEEQARFVELYNQKPIIPMSRIAEMMGRSKGSVCGMRSRMKLKPRPRVAIRGERNPYGPPPHVVRNDGKPRAPRQAPDQSDFVAAQETLEAAVEKGFPNGGKTFLELGSSDCRFIYGDPVAGGHKFCGARSVTGKSWCQHHYRVVYRDLR